MAMATVDPHLAGVQLVGKTDGLNRRISFNSSNGRGDKPRNQGGDHGDRNDYRQVEFDLVVQPIPIRFHATSPWLWKSSDLTLL